MTHFSDCLRKNKIITEKTPHRVAIINRVLYSLIRKVEPHLKQIHSGHGFDSAHWSPAFSFRIIWAYHPDPFRPWNHIVHLTQKFILPGRSLSRRVFHIRECVLPVCHCRYLPFLGFNLLYHVFLRLASFWGIIQCFLNYSWRILVN